MTEDEIYRASTQYRLWSYTEASLASLRAATNSLAATRVKNAIDRLHADKEDGGEASQSESSHREVDCLTVEEEQKLVNFYCIKAMDLSDFCEFPTNVKATAVQYLKRFYLSNSPMTYHPKEMMPSAVFLSTKTENCYISLKRFTSMLPNTSEEAVVAPEFLLTQGLRFTFDVRHPQRGIEAGYMELTTMATGIYQGPPAAGKSAHELQQEMLELPLGPDAIERSVSAEELKTRIQRSVNEAKGVLKTSALLTDAYFLYTPAQIWLAALAVVDLRLAEFYVQCKMPNTAIRARLTSVLEACVALLSSSSSVKPGAEEMKELKRIDKKLYKCRNPDKIDLVGINKAQKRDGEGKAEGVVDEKVIKKRKLERENGMRDDMFGPSIE